MFCTNASTSLHAINTKNIKYVTHLVTPTVVDFVGTKQVTSRNKVYFEI